MAQHRFDIAIVGAGHNGLVAAALLARAGRSVVMLERRPEPGGAAISEEPFPGVPARLSRYSYLVSLFPRGLLRSLGVPVEMRRRRVASYTPHGDSGVLFSDDAARTRESLGEREHERWERFKADLEALAGRLFPTLTEPLRTRYELRGLLADEAAWRALIEEPLAELIERSFTSDLVRGIALTDALIGTFASARDPSLAQNRCFLYHVIGNGTGRWDVPVGGMGALTAALINSARSAGALIRTGSEVVAIGTDGADAEVHCAGGERLAARHVLANVAPAELARLLGEAPAAGEDRPEGSQLKLNMVLTRLPRLRDRSVAPEEAFAGTFHVNEGYEQLQQAYEQARAGAIPALPPCEIYCHSLTDPTIISGELRAAGAHTLTLFALHMPARLFPAGDDTAKSRAIAATLRSLNSVLAEPIEECLWTDAAGRPCLEAITPPELESDLRMPGGHIFHRELSWPFAEEETDAGAWGTETAYTNVWLCGAGARRGGGVSGIPGHNAARAVLESR